MSHVARPALRGLVAACALVAAPLRSQQPAPPTAPAPLGAEQWRDDLRIMMQALPRVHTNLYHSTSRATFDSAARALHERIPSLARHEIVMELARIAALAGDGHTNVYPTRDAAIGFRTLPVALYLFADGLHVRAADRAHAALAGARVVRIGDATPEEAYRRLRPYVGRDNEMGLRFFAPHLLAMPEVLHALRLAPGPDSARFELESGGRRRTVWLRAAGPADLMVGDGDRSWRRKAGWVDARDGASAPEPLWLRHAPDTVLWWFTRVPGSDAVYAQINQIRDGGGGTMEEFSRGLLAFLDTARVERLVLDLRLDRGGNGSLRMPLVRGLLRQPKVNARGRLYVLTGRATFSAAQFLLDDLDTYAEAVFVGEPSASRGNHYGDSRQTRLPNSGITVRASTKYWQDWSPDDARPWIGPAIAAELTFADYRANRDPALAAALADVPGPTLDEELRAAVAADDTARARARLRAFRAHPANAYADAHRMLDAAALHFHGRKDLPRATWLFALAADAYPDVARAHLNLSVMHREAGRLDLERAALERAVAIEPTNAAAAARLQALRRP